MRDPGSDALGGLARSLGRPRASLAAFSALTPAELTSLSEAIDATVVSRSRELDDAFAAALPAAAPLLGRMLRSRGSAALRRRLIRRQGAA